jgi:quinol-cytochrome oxidoreductase complex cytochrome b subunit
VEPTLTLCGQTPGLLSSSPAAWCSTYYIVHSVPFGSVLLTTHLYGAYVTIFLTFFHLFAGYYRGSYKKAGREFSWVAGVVLLFLVLAMGFTGYLLTYTQLSYNATQVSITLVQAIPWVGTPLANLLIGDGTAQSLLSRMFAFHVVLLPLAILALVFLHKRTALFPRVYLYLVKWGLLYVGLLIGVAYLWPWPLPTYVGNIAVPQPVTVPPWFFLWLFKLVDFVGVTPEEAMLFTLVLLLFLLLLPFLDRSSGIHPRDRPVFLFLGNSLVGFFILMTAWGDLTPGVPITPVEVALRLGPILAGNALAVAFFYSRYRRSCAAHPAEPGPTPGGAPPPGPEPGKAAESPETSRVRAPPSSLPMFLSVGAIVGALFLLAFGLLLPFLFLFAAGLVSLAESVRPARPSASEEGAERWNALLFPLVAFLATVGLLLALILVIVA